MTTGRPCSVCSGERDSIEAALLDGESLSSIASRTGIARTSLRRHRSNHMAVDAAALDAMGLSPVAIASRVLDIAERGRMLADDAIDAGNTNAAIKAADSELRALSALASLGIVHEDAAAELATYRVAVNAVMRAARLDPTVAQAIAAQLDSVDQLALSADLRNLIQETRKAIA